MSVRFEIRSGTPKRLAEEVEQLLNEGWQLHGGPIVQGDILRQAVVRYPGPTRHSYTRGQLKQCLDDWNELEPDAFVQRWDQMLADLRQRYHIREYGPEFDPAYVIRRAMKDAKEGST